MRICDNFYSAATDKVKVVEPTSSRRGLGFGLGLGLDLGLGLGLGLGLDLDLGARLQDGERGTER